ncbi:hypothetical protein F5884DRAFT_684341 [Xylogone sp. PMI_703]|nr:hypothetical protein F5884DRAFT_684341 [Xylogone sp. PMI_703]
MSKITSKNLQYDSTLPPFLARMQANQSSRDGRHEFAIARPKKPRNAEEDAEDEPVVFDEVSGESLTKKQWEEREQEDSRDTDEGEGEKTAAGEASERTKEKIAEIGAVKKRKAGKIVGGGDDGEEGDDNDDGKSSKKGKKIKLSFGDDE